MLNRRSLLSQLLAPAALATGLIATSTASGRSAKTDFVGLDGWLNTSGPLTVSGLRGKVVLVEFGTYTCINWRRTLPYVNRWHREYGHRGLQVILVHTPEFSFERIRPNIETILPGLGVTYPVALDSDYQTWRAWQNRAWPALYLFGRDGRLRLLHEGEGHSTEIEAEIRNLLGLAQPSGSLGEDADLSSIGTAEFYFGSLHDTPQDSAQQPRGGEADYMISNPSGPRLNTYDLQGTWMRADERLVLRSDAGRLRIRFSAAKLHLVAGAPRSAPVRIRIDEGTQRIIEIGLPTLYTLLDGNTYGQHLLEIDCVTPGLTLYSATFG